MATKVNLTTQSKVTGDLSFIDAIDGVTLRGITNVRQPIADSDVATLRTVKALAGQGTELAACKAVSTAAVTLSAPGSVIDGVVMTAGDRVLLALPTADATNGVWIWNGAAVAMTRPTDMLTGPVNFSEIVQDTVFITNGPATHANSTWKQTAAIGTGVLNGITNAQFVIDTDPQLWVLTGIVNLTAAIANSFIKNEVPVATAPLVLDANGNATTAGTVVTIAHTPFTLATGDTSQSVYKNGVEQQKGQDYTIAGAVITMLQQLVVTDNIRVSYFH